jgi:tetratricopeptide (TPR) repeat protein
LEQHTEAIVDYNTAIELNPKLAAAYAARGIAHAAQGKEDAARADLKKALDLNPALRELVQSTSDRFQLGL